MKSSSQQPDPDDLTQWMCRLPKQKQESEPTWMTLFGALAVMALFSGFVLVALWWLRTQIGLW